MSFLSLVGLLNLTLILHPETSRWGLRTRSGSVSPLGVFQAYQCRLNPAEACQLYSCPEVFDTLHEEDKSHVKEVSCFTEWKEKRWKLQHLGDWRSFRRLVGQWLFTSPKSLQPSNRIFQSTSCFCLLTDRNISLWRCKIQFTPFFSIFSLQIPASNHASSKPHRESVEYFKESH